MDTFRFGRRLKLPATSSIKHQLRTMMWKDEVNKAEREAPVHTGGELQYRVKGLRENRERVLKENDLETL